VFDGDTPKETMILKRKPETLVHAQLYDKRQSVNPKLQTYNLNLKKRKSPKPLTLVCSVRTNSIQDFFILNPIP